jgi:hypothetical protein
MLVVMFNVSGDGNGGPVFTIMLTECYSELSTWCELSLRMRVREILEVDW